MRGGAGIPAALCLASCEANRCPLLHHRRSIGLDAADLADSDAEEGADDGAVAVADPRREEEGQRVFDVAGGVATVTGEG